MLHEGGEVHAIQLVAGKNKYRLFVLQRNVNEILTHGVGGSAVPIVIGSGLFRRQHFHKTARKVVEAVGLSDVPMEGFGVELRQEINLIVSGVQAVADGNIHQTVFAAQRYGGFATHPRQRFEPRSATASHNNANNI